MNPTEIKNVQRILNISPDNLMVVDSSMYIIGYAVFGLVSFVIGFGLAFLIWGL